MKKLQQRTQNLKKNLILVCKIYEFVNSENPHFQYFNPSITCVRCLPKGHPGDRQKLPNQQEAGEKPGVAELAGPRQGAAPRHRGELLCTAQAMGLMALTGQMAKSVSLLHFLISFR